jgi:pyrimidine-nucleoside phosphorylase
MTFNPIALIEKKRDGGTLSPAEISDLVGGFVDGRIPDYQMSAFLMAVVIRGMDDAETLALLDAFVKSGDVIDLSSVPGIKVDKHSTGGVGDKVSLVVAPLVAAAGVPVPMMAGRGLGHTGGTLDKLESIPGFSTQLSEAAFRTQIETVGCAIIGQSDRIVPADRKAYALRDVTGTVPSLPLICSSILSKKKAEGTDALVLDVKAGRGAFFEDRARALALAEALVSLGNRAGLRTVAYLTAMDQPLGFAVGNWLEVAESLEVLGGGGPEDVRRLTLSLAAEMLVLGGKASTVLEAARLLEPLLDSGAALEKFRDMVRAQGGDVSAIDRPDRMPAPAHTAAVRSPVDGWVAGVDARGIGLASVALGAGRIRKEDAVDPLAGIRLLKKISDPVKKGDVLAVAQAGRKDAVDRVLPSLSAAFRFGGKPAAPMPLIDCRIGPSDVAAESDASFGDAALPKTADRESRHGK